MNVAPPTVHVRAGFWCYVAALTLVGILMSAASGMTAAAGQIAYGLLFATASAAFLFLHETGHAVGGAIVGMRWTGITFSLGRAATTLDTDSAVTHRQRFWSTLAGPGLQAAASIVCLTVTASNGHMWSPAGFAATISLIEAAANLLLPLPGLDCRHLLTSGRHLLSGRGHLPQTV